MPFVLFALAIAWTVMLLFGGLDMDRALLLFFYAGERPEIAQPARILTELGGYKMLMPLSAAGALWLAWRRRFRAAVILLVVTMSGRVFVEFQKVQLGRVRPSESEHLIDVHSLSFPSAHASNSTMVYLSLALLLTSTYPRRSIALWIAAWLAILIGASRVVLGVHWPSDVIAGWAFGLFWTLLLLRLAGHDVGDGRPPGLKEKAEAAPPPP